MKLSRALEQHIAVFGESGSGKTVLLSSFYGAMQEPQFLQESLFRVLADDIGQGAHLHRNYLGMKNSARAPATNRFSATPYSFLVKLKDGNSKVQNGQPFDALRLVWHDYPGQWFEQEVSGSEEAQRRIDTFKSLLSSDVAILLVDGQLLLENAGQEERYLKSLLADIRNGLLALKDDLLEDGKPLIEFPRIWIIALSKADLLPELDVYEFRDLLIEKAADDIDELRKVLAGLVEANTALSVGEDFMVLSSAEFGADKIEVTKRQGVDLMLPIAAMLPIERHVEWAKQQQLPAKVLENLLDGVRVVVPLILPFVPKLKLLDRLVRLIDTAANDDKLDQAVKLAEDKLKEINSEARAKENYLTAVLTGFRMDLEKGEKDRVLIRRP